MRDRTILIISVVGLVLLIGGAVTLGVYFYAKTNGECTKDPIGFYNNNSDLFGYKGTAIIYNPSQFYNPSN